MVDQSKSFVPPPPRLTGDYTTDNVIIREWMQAFYNSFEASGFVPVAQFAEPDTIDPASPPTPTDTTIAKAQATANLALDKATQAVDALIAHSLFP